MKLPIYEIVIDDNDDEMGLDLISIVQNPAIEVKGVKLAKQLELELLQGDVVSSNVDSYKYNTNNGELILTFNDGSRYRYSGVDFTEYENIILGDAVCETEGQNEFGSWFVGKTPSVGAAVWEYLIRTGVKYERLNKQFAFSVNAEKKKIVGPALIPDMDIYRRDPDGFEYYIRFSKETIEKLVEKFNKGGSNRRINFNHTNQMVDAFINSSWIKESDNDKSVGYPDFKDLPVGTWFVEVKIENEKFWQEKVKGEDYYSFSIEGILGLEKVEMSKIEDFIDTMTEEDFFEIYTDLKKKQRPVRFQQTYSDYPEAAKDAARKALKWVEKNGWGKCGTQVGKVRANQIAKGEPLSRETISRIASFARHLQYEGREYGDGCSALMIDSWGSRVMIEWAQRKLKEIDAEKKNK
jgi:hypothetical protein